MSDEVDRIVEALAEAESASMADRARRIRAKIAKEKGIPKGKVTAAMITEVANMEAEMATPEGEVMVKIIAAFANKEMKQAANREAKLKLPPPTLPIGGVLAYGWVVIVEDKLEFSHDLITTQHYSSPEFAVRVAFERWDFSARRWNSLEEIEAAYQQFVETGMLDDGEYRLRLVPVSLVVREEGSNATTEAH